MYKTSRSWLVFRGGERFIYCASVQVECWYSGRVDAGETYQISGISSMGGPTR